MKTLPILALGTVFALLGCNGTDRPTPTGAEVQAQDQQRKQSIDNNPAIPPEARARIQQSLQSGKR